MTETTKRRAIGMKRIHRAKDKEDIVELLTHESTGLFREMWRLLLFAAMLGFKHERREPLGAVQPGEGIRQDVFNNNPVWQGTIYLLGLISTGSTEALQSTEEAEDLRIKIFEEYANGGLAKLKEELIGSDGGIDSMLTFLNLQEESRVSHAPNLNVSI